MFSSEPKGYNAKQLNILAGPISGIVGSRRTNYPQIASKVPDRAKPESRVKRISRYVNEADETQEVHRMSFAIALLSNLADRTLVLVVHCIHEDSCLNFSSLPIDMHLILTCG
jgi:hypothetical protein